MIDLLEAQFDGTPVDKLHVEFREIKTEQRQQREAELWKRHHQTDEGWL